MDISIVIVNYNVKEFLRSAILSVERSLIHGGLSGEILVVDNNSTDESAAFVRSHFPSVRLFALDENLGFGRANNLALREATGEYFLILNPDTILGEDTLEIMVRFMREHPDAGLAGCKLLNGDGSFQLSCRRGFPTPWASFAKLFGLSRLFPRSKLFARYNLTYMPVEATYEVDALGGAFMVMSRKALEATGGFDERFFMYGEDLDLCYQVKKAGFRVYYVHETATIHFKGESTRRSAINELRVFYEAMDIFVRKNYRTSAFFSLLLRFGIFLRSGLALIRKYRGAIVLGVLDAITVCCSVLVASRLVLSKWFGLPAADYPLAILAPSFVVVLVFIGLQAYAPDRRRNIREVLIGMPAALVLLSSLTYFFKEYASSRSLVLSIAATATVLLAVERLLLRTLDRLRFGGEHSARPTMKRTIVVGTTEEAVRIAGLLTRTQITKHYQVVGFVDRTLSRMGEEIVLSIPILGDTTTIAKIVRDERIGEVVFASDALSHTEMLGIMQRVSDENASRVVNFNVVPSASDILLGRRKIEVLVPLITGGDQIALVPIQYNIQRFSHRLAKRLVDVVAGSMLVPYSWVVQSVWPSATHSELLDRSRRILRGELSLVGIAGETGGTRSLAKSGITSLAKITLASLGSARAEDIAELDLYYAQNHTLGMDLEILIRSLFIRSN